MQDKLSKDTNMRHYTYQKIMQLTHQSLDTDNTKGAFWIVKYPGERSLVYKQYELTE